MSSRPVSVLFVDHAEAMGGAEHSLITLMDRLDKTRFRPVLACNDSPLAAAARQRAIPTRIVDMPKIRSRPASPWLLARGSLALVRLIRRERIDIVHSNVMRASFYAAVAAQLSRRPLVWHVRDIHRERWYLQLMCRLSDRAVAISRAVALPIPCGAMTEIVYNGVDLAPFDRADGQAFRAEIGVVGNQPLVGIVGRVRPWKGHRLFLQAAAQVARVHPDARFAVVGDVLFPSDRDFLAELKTFASELGVSDRVVFTGHRTDIPAVMAALDLLVHTAEAEPFGRVLVEAMAASRPVVAFRDGGVPEIVVHDETGLLVSPGDVAGVVDVIVDLLWASNRREEMGRAGRRRVERTFSATGMARHVEAIYDDLVGVGDSHGERPPEDPVHPRQRPIREHTAESRAGAVGRLCRTGRTRADLGAGPHTQ